MLSKYAHGDLVVFTADPTRHPYVQELSGSIFKVLWWDEEDKYYALETEEHPYSLVAIESELKPAYLA